MASGKTSIGCISICSRFLLSLFFISLTSATASADSAGTHAQTFGPDLNLRSPNIKVDRGQSIHTPAPKVRDRIFDQVGITSYIAALDHLDRDRLYDRSGVYPLNRMAQLYPNVPEKNLESLRIAVLQREISVRQAKAHASPQSNVKVTQ
jgi:hypothetical protein